LVGDGLVALARRFGGDLFGLVGRSRLTIGAAPPLGGPFEIAGSTTEIGVVLAFRRAVVDDLAVDADEHRPGAGFDLRPAVVARPRVDHQRPPIESASRAVSLS